jgi:hypothetical protein
MLAAGRPAAAAGRDRLAAGPTVTLWENPAVVVIAVEGVAAVPDDTAAAGQPAWRDACSQHISSALLSCLRMSELPNRQYGIGFGSIKTSRHLRATRLLAVGGESVRQQRRP